MSRARHPSALALLLLAVVAAPAAAQGFHYTDVQLLYGNGFHDRVTGDDTRRGTESTITFESFTTWKYGDSFFFADFTNGAFVDFGGAPLAQRHRIYSEWSPRVSLGKLAGHAVAGGPVADVLLAGQINRGGDGFAANLIGAGVDLRVPAFAHLEVDGYYRDDHFNGGTYQVTTVWVSPFRLGPTRWAFQGFVDVAGTDGAGTDVTTQPQLLIDLGALVGGRPGTLHAGTEWWYHSNDLVTTSAPEVMVRWTF